MFSNTLTNESLNNDDRIRAKVITPFNLSLAWALPSFPLVFPETKRIISEA